MIDIIVFAEAQADARLARDLADRVMREQGPEWLGDALSSIREWRGLRADQRFVKWAREAWVLNGFQAANTTERKRLDRLRSDLGFDPVADAHRLRATAAGEKRSAKRVLATLTGEDHQRETQCWTDTPLDRLTERGERTGLRDFLSALKKGLLSEITSTGRD